MAGTKEQVIGLPGFYVTNILAATDTAINSLEGGFQVDSLQDRAICWVEEAGSNYRWDEGSLVAPDGAATVIPLGQNVLVPGRWLIEATQGAQGNQGFQGVAGAQGNQGFQGVAGAQGNQGFQGVAGAQGNQGFQGDAGAQGAGGLTAETVWITEVGTGTFHNYNPSGWDDADGVIFSAENGGVTGFQRPTATGKRFKMIKYTANAGTMILANQSGSSSVGNRISIPLGEDTTGVTGSFWMEYNDTNDQWEAMGSGSNS